MLLKRSALFLCLLAAHVIAQSPNATVRPSRLPTTPSKSNVRVTTASTTLTQSNCEFQCKNKKKCIQRSWVCDGEFDCSDDSDEQGCTTRTPPTHPANCRPNLEFRCHRDGKCIRNTYVCDGDRDCSDWSDEDNCPPTPCTGFMCDNGRCLGDWAVCNYYDNCRDKSDERNCTCPSYRFLCGDGSCIGDYDRCDGHNDCDNDEENCPLSASKGAVAAVAVSCVMIGVLLIVGVSVGLCIKSKNGRQPAQPHQSWPTEAIPAYRPGGMHPTSFMQNPPPIFQDQPPPFEGALPEKRQPSPPDNPSDNGQSESLPIVQITS